MRSILYLQGLTETGHMTIPALSLYHDMSARVMASLATFSPQPLEVFTGFQPNKEEGVSRLQEYGVIN